jgi:hypothetical protein
MSSHERLEGGLVMPTDEAFQQLCVRPIAIIAPKGGT